mmetsp:Transcript_124550/g.346784  ORF Transcript_124550/g.346784 Transcript_124550/m.346784 type:complete len:428 (-) Transcript_124550:153-1436(-)
MASLAVVHDALGAGDSTALMAAGSDLEAVAGRTTRQRGKVAFGQRLTRPAIYAGALALALVVIGATTALAARQKQHPAVVGEGTLLLEKMGTPDKQKDKATEKREDNDKSSKEDKDDDKDSEKGDEPKGCCSWDNTHCGKVQGRCVGGIKQCEFCKGQWITLPQKFCDKGHSLEKPLPKIWNYTASGKKHATVKVLSYNLYWWFLFDKSHGNGGSAGHLIKGASKDKMFDMMGFQECNWPLQVFWDAGMGKDYHLIHTNQNICIATLNKTWELLQHGETVVANDGGGPGQNYGQRTAMWVRLRQKETNETVFFMNHHGPLPLGSGGQYGAPSTVYNLLKVIMSKAGKDDAVIFVGDFNSDADSMTVNQLQCRLNKVFSGTKFGGVDHIFSNLGGANVVSTANLGQGGSDHDAISAVFQLGSKGAEKA